MSSNINVKHLNVDKRKFFIYWLEFLKPYHKLRKKQLEALSVFLLKRHELSLKIKDDALIDKMLFSPSVKDEIRIELGYKNSQVLRNMLTGLRKKSAIINNKINVGLIPNYEEDNSSFRLVFNFNIDETRHSAKKNNKRVDVEIQPL